MAVKRLTLEDVATLLGMAGAAGFMGGGSGGGFGGYGGSTGGVKGPRNGGNGGFGGGSGGSGSGTGGGFGGGFGGGSDGSFSGGGEYGDFLTEILQSVGIGPGASIKDSASKYPESSMYVDVLEVGNGVHNAKLQVGVAEEAAKMQTLEEHNNAINKFLKPGQTPAQRAEALRKGKEAERKLLSFWADDRPRVNYTPSSSAVEAIRITPENRIEVKWRGKPSKNNPSGWYTFLPSVNPYKASEAFQALVTAPSIGRAVYPVVSRPLKKFNPYINNNWNKKHYDPSKATAKVR